MKKLLYKSAEYLIILLLQKHAGEDFPESMVITEAEKDLLTK